LLGIGDDLVNKQQRKNEVPGSGKEISA